MDFFDIFYSIVGICQNHCTQEYHGTCAGQLDSSPDCVSFVEWLARLQIPPHHQSDRRPKWFLGSSKLKWSLRAWNTLKQLEITNLFRIHVTFGILWGFPPHLVRHLLLNRIKGLKVWSRTLQQLNLKWKHERRMIWCRQINTITWWYEYYIYIYWD